MDFRVVDPRIKPVVLGLVRKYPFVPDYLHRVVQLEQNVQDENGWYYLGIYDHVSKSIGFFWHGKSHVENARVYQVVAHEVMHVVFHWLEDQGGRIVFDMPTSELSTISKYAVKANKDEEVLCEAMSFAHIGVRNPAINYLVNLVEKEIERVQAR